MVNGKFTIHNSIVDAALQKKWENDRKLRRVHPECVLIAEESNGQAQKELEKLQRRAAENDADQNEYLEGLG